METVISVSAYNSKGKVVNGEWESILAETMIINNGDTIAIKDAYIDTRTRSSDDIYIEEDTTLILEFYYYYVNTPTDGTTMKLYYKQLDSNFIPNDVTLSQWTLTEATGWSDGLPYLLMGWYHEYNFVTHSYNTNTPLAWTPIVGKWQYVLKQGSYTKDYLAVLLTKNMAKVSPTLYGAFCGVNIGLDNNMPILINDPNLNPAILQTQPTILSNNVPFVVQTKLYEETNYYSFMIYNGSNPANLDNAAPFSNQNNIPIMLISINNIEGYNMRGLQVESPNPPYIILPVFTTTIINSNPVRNQLLTPLIGATEISLLWNNQNNGIYSFDYLHSPILYGGKEVVVASKNVVNEIDVTIAMCDRQSGVILAQMTPSLFWGDTLGFNLNQITYIFEESNIPPQIQFKLYQSITTGNYWGSAMINFNQITVPISSQTYWFPISFPDCIYENLVNGYTGTITWESDSTNTLDASQAPLNPNDTGHFLIELNGYQTNYFDENDAYQIKSIISSYYITANSFATAPFPDSFVYEHHGEPLIIGGLRVRILNPKTKKVLPIGPNSTVYLQITQQLTPETVQQPDL
jgi:hypothetical protein